MGRTLPTKCIHGFIIDWGDFGDEEQPPEPCADCERERFNGTEQCAKELRHAMSKLAKRAAKLEKINARQEELIATLHRKVKRLHEERDEMLQGNFGRALAGQRTKYERIIEDLRRQNNGAPKTSPDLHVP